MHLYVARGAVDLEETGPLDTGDAARLSQERRPLGGEPDRLDLLIMQFVHLVRGGEKVSMSKRAGEFVTLAELVPSLRTSLSARLEPGLWPSSAHADCAGEVTVGGVPLRHLAAQHGTPTYVLDIDDVRLRCQEATRRRTSSRPRI